VLAVDLEEAEEVARRPKPSVPSVVNGAAMCEVSALLGTTYGATVTAAESSLLRHQPDGTALAGRRRGADAAGGDRPGRAAV
jgi:hypothetical protein